MRPVVLTIAGSDSSAGAGIQADLKAIEASGGYAACAITAITAQNTRGVRRAECVAPDLVEAQIDAVFDDLSVAAVKSGMLGGEDVLRAVARALRRRAARPYVLDPVLFAASGDALLPLSCLDPLREELFPLADVVTPNVPEAEALTGLAIVDLAGAERAARRLLELGARAVVVKGGHLRGAPATDLLVSPDVARAFPGERIDTPHTHGTGCTFSAALATALALGAGLEEAVGRAKRFVTAAIRHGLPLGGGRGPADGLFRLHAIPSSVEASR